MADEAYRAVFLRVHPTGKMVLSLTTESDGREAEYAQLVAGELGVPALDVKVVPADTDRFGVGHGFNTSPSAGTPRRRSRPPASRIRDKARLLAGAALEAAAREPHVVERRLGRRRRRRPERVKTIEDVALYAHGTGAAAAGRRGRPRRAGRLPGLRRLRGGPRARPRPRRRP